MFSYTYILNRKPDSLVEGASVSASSAIDFTFSGVKRAHVRGADGRTVERRIAPLSGGGTGPDELTWVRNEGLAEFVEIHPSRTLREEVAEDCRRADLAQLGDCHTDADAPLRAAAFRLRAHALSGQHLSDLEADSLIRTLVRRRIERFGGTTRRGPLAGLDTNRLERVSEYAHANAARMLSLGEMADVAAVSRHHFARMFRRSTGMTPHAYVTALRMQRAMNALGRGATVGEAAASVGYAPGHAFRQAFLSAFGRSPGAVANEVAG